MQSQSEMNIFAGLGVAVREFKLTSGFADYLLYLDGRAAGVIEAKPEGYSLTGVEIQSAKYVDGLPGPRFPTITCRCRLPTNRPGLSRSSPTRLIPDARSREVFTFHRPEELFRLIKLDQQLRANLREMPELDTTRLWRVQSKAITNLEQSLADNRPRALIQMANWVGGRPIRRFLPATRLIKFAKAQRILFLVDRNNLGRQTLTEFQQYISPYTNYNFTEEYNVQHLKRNTVDPAAKVCITTIQRLYSHAEGRGRLRGTKRRRLAVRDRSVAGQGAAPGRLQPEDPHRDVRFHHRR